MAKNKVSCTNVYVHIPTNGEGIITNVDKKKTKGLIIF